MSFAVNRTADFRPTYGSMVPFIAAVLFFVLNYPTLSEFPFVHSDETWLGGLTRSMIAAESLSETEAFFDLYQRRPHAVKIGYHLLQKIWFRLFGYSITAIRSLSLAAGSAALIGLYRFVRITYRSSSAALLVMLLMAFDLQYIYAARTGRQEIWLILFMVLSLNLLAHSIAVDPKPPGSGWRLAGSGFLRSSAAGLVIGAAFTYHPNGLIVLTVPLVLLMFRDGERGRSSRQHLLFFGFGAVLAAGAVLVSSLAFNSNFIRDYLAYGESLGVTASPGAKISGLFGFYAKIWHQLSGTYYTPPIQPHMIFSALVVIGAGTGSFISREFRRDVLPLLAGWLAMQAAFITIGRYGQPSVVLNTPVIILMGGAGLSNLRRKADCCRGKVPIGRMATGLFFILAAASLYLTVTEISRVRSSSSSYGDYLKALSASVPEEAVVLANINTEPLFPPGQLYDWRNLGQPEMITLGIEAYISARKITCIVYPEEIDVIFTQRPLWNGMYGNIAPIYDELQHFLSARCELVAEFPAPTYAMRIVRYQQDRDWTVRVYRVIDTTE